MKRKLLYLILSVGLIAGLTGCYEDQSTEATHTIPEIMIDTTGIKPLHSLKRFERLQITPSVSKEDTDPSEFSYKWMLSLQPIQNTNTIGTYVCIGEEKDLDAEITVDDDETPYNLWYQVTDNTTGLRKDIVWQVRVLAPYGEGLLVAESHDNGKTADLALIENEHFSTDYTNETLIRHNIFSEANEGAKIEGEVSQIHAFKKNHKTKYYSIFTKSGEDRLLTMNKKYEVMFRNKECFVEECVDVINPTAFHVAAGQAAYMVNNNQVHWAWFNDNTWTGQWGPAIPNQGKSVSIDKTFAAGYGNSPSYWCYYDPTAGCIKKMYNTLMRWDLSSISVVSKGSGWAFDPSNCPGYECVYGGLAPGNRTYLLLRNKESGKYCVFGANSSGNADRYYEIPEFAAMDDAIAYATNENGNVIYFATSNKVYSIILNAEPVMINEVYSSSEEITHFSIFRQAKATTDYYAANLIASGNVVLVGTWNGQNGTVHAIPMLNYNTGELQTAGTVKFEGFGKIMAIIHQFP